MSRPRTLDPQRLEMRAFAEAGATLEGELAQADLSRLQESLLATDLAPPPVRWQARGEQRPVAGGTPETWLGLQASTTVTLSCQRCLQPVAETLQIDRRFRFVEGEEEAERLDEELEDDVLAAGRSFDLLELLEDELILALPLVPRHAECPQPLPLAPEAPEEAPPNPFAALAALRRTPGG
jgi:uncharacterized protein